MTVRLTGLAVHPVKSTAVRAVERAEVQPWGLVDDRRWMVVDAAGECLTARDEARLLAVTASTPTTDPGQASQLRLSAPGPQPLDVDLPRGGPVVDVTVHGRPLQGVAVADGATAWLRAALGRDGLRLVHVHRPRPLNPAHSRPGDATAFADGYPVTLASAASLRRLDDWVAQTALERGEDPSTVPMARFRPNLVVDGDLEPFEEDGWSAVTVGHTRFRVVKAVDRCAMTLVDPVTLARGHEPIRTLARHRKWQGATWFAMQLVPDVDDVRGVVTVSDVVVPER